MTTSNKMKIDLDPRLLANQQKIISYLSGLAEESLKQRRSIELLMKEQQHFQKDVYRMLRRFDHQLEVTQESVDGIQDTMEYVGGKTQSIYKRVRSLQNVSSHVPEGGRDLMCKSLNIPSQTKPGRGSRARQHNYGMDDNPSDSDNDGRFGTRRKERDRRDQMENPGPMGDPNLLPPPNSRHDTEKLPFQPKLSPLTTDSRSHNDIGSPVQMQNLPPNVPKPDARGPQQHLGSNFPPGLSNLSRGTLPGQPVIKRNPQEKDFISLMRKVGMDVNPSTVAAVSKATHGNMESAPQALGLHTVLILDTSTSMQGEPLRALKSFVSTMIDTIDRSAGERGLEEHVAVVTCGATTTIVQGFTNNYLQIKNIIGTGLDRLPVEGRTPLMTALVLTLCYMELRGECVDQHGYLIPPRVVIVSDFQVTNDKSFTGPDTESNTDRIQVQSQIFALMHHFRERRYPVICVPVGERNQSVYEEMSKMTGGDILSVADADIAGNYYRFQYVVGEVLYKFNQALDEGQEEDLEALVQQALQLAGVDYRHQDLVMDLLTRELESANVASDLDEVAIDNEVPEHPQMPPVTGAPAPPFNTQAPPINRETVASSTNQRQATPHRQPSPALHRQTPPQVHEALADLPEWTPSKRVDQLSLEERADLPPIGTRVQRGPDWKWDNQDGKGPGTIVGHDVAGLVFIQFDNAKIGKYRYNFNGREYDVTIDTHCRQVPEGHIEIGCWVKRGLDWTRGDEDGGAGTVGVVVRKLSDRKVQVRWPSRVIEAYKFGNENKWEVTVTDQPPRSVSLNTPPIVVSDSQSPSMDSSAQAQGTRTAQPDESKGEMVIWKWKDKSNQWRLFSLEAMQRITMVKNRGDHKQMMVQYRDKNAKIFLDRMSCEINGVIYPLDTGILPQTEVMELYEVEKFLTD